jgi:lysophospholipase L1-like esterase
MIRWSKENGNNQLVALILLSVTTIAFLGISFYQAIISTKIQSKLTVLENWTATVDHRLAGNPAIPAIKICRSPNCAHFLIRFVIIQRQIAQAGPGGIIFLGDSNTEGTSFPQRLCGKATINAGVGGVQVGSLSQFSKSLIHIAKPSAIVISVGVNDAWKLGGTTPLKIFRKQYLALVETALNAKVPVLVTLIPPVEAGKPLGAQAFSSEMISRFNDEILEISREKRLVLVDVHKDLAAENGFAKPGSTIDGVHLSAVATSSWLDKVTEAISTKFVGCYIMQLL